MTPVCFRLNISKLSYSQLLPYGCSYLSIRFIALGQRRLINTSKMHINVNETGMAQKLYSIHCPQLGNCLKHQTDLQLRSPHRVAHEMAHRKTVKIQVGELLKMQDMLKPPGVGIRRGD